MNFFDKLFRKKEIEEDFVAIKNEEPKYIETDTQIIFTAKEWYKLLTYRTTLIAYGGGYISRLAYALNISDPSYTMGGHKHHFLYLMIFDESLKKVMIGNKELIITHEIEVEK